MLYLFDLYTFSSSSIIQKCLNLTNSCFNCLKKLLEMPNIHPRIIIHLYKKMCEYKDINACYTIFTTNGEIISPPNDNYTLI